tara:strand:+ start:8325 stop:9461 length:1137 start_codon:yes stop_codon:yes gene_type:complete
MHIQHTPNERIIKIEKTILRGVRPRSIGYNARKGTHGPNITDAVVRLFTNSGAWGIGPANISQDTAKALLGSKVDEIFQLPYGAIDKGIKIDLPLWDLTARILSLPLYRLLGARGKRHVELYDASIYIDDINLNNEQAVGLFQEEVHSGLEHGYQNFKIKVGRGSRWMEPSVGLQRDALVVHTVREASPTGSKLMIDANMGGTLNSTLELIKLCAEYDLYWFEEPFAEDKLLNHALKSYIIESDSNLLIADGEFHPPSYFFELVEEGLIDVVQHDFCDYGLTWWRSIAAKLETWNAVCAPHTWGSYIERYHHAHFAASIPNYAILEASPGKMPGIIEDGWSMQDGKLHVPDTPGVGIAIEEKIFNQGLEDRAAFSLSI